MLEIFVRINRGRAKLIKQTRHAAQPKFEKKKAKKEANMYCCSFEAFGPYAVYRVGGNRRKQYAITSRVCMLYE